MTDAVVWVIYLYLRRRRRWRWRWRRDADRCVDARLNIRACLACLYATPGDAAPASSHLSLWRDLRLRGCQHNPSAYSLAHCTSQTWVSQSSCQIPFNLRLCLRKHLAEHPSYLRHAGIVEKILFISEIYDQDFKVLVLKSSERFAQFKLVSCPYVLVNSSQYLKNLYIKDSVQILCKIP